MPTQKSNSIKISIWQKQLLQVVAFVFLVSLGAQLNIDIGGEVALSLQTFFLAVCYHLMSKKVRVISVLIYLGLGIAGIGVFANGGSGWAHFTGPGLGFLLGFLAVAFVNPMDGSFQNILSYMLLVHLIILISGIVVIAIVNKDVKVLTELGLNLLPGAVIKSLLAAGVCYFFQKNSAFNGLYAR